MTYLNLNEFIAEYQTDSAELILGDDYMSLSLTGEFNACAEKINEKLASFEEEKRPILAINFSYLFYECISEPLRPVAHYESTLYNLSVIIQKMEEKGKKVCLLGVSETIRDWLLPMLQNKDVFYPSLTEALKKVSTNETCATEMELFKTAVTKVFSTMFGVTANLMNQEKGGELSGEVFGMVPLMSKGSCGSVVMSFKKSMLQNLGKRAFGEVLNENDPNLVQIAGEIVNMILGLTKNDLNKRGYGLDQVIPKMYALGEETLPLQLHKGHRMTFQCEEGQFFIEISMP